VSDLAPRVRATGLLAPGARVLVLLSGGRDSVCLLDLAVRLAGPGAVSALHVNYALRDSAGDDEAFCAELCRSLEVPLEVRRPRRPGGTGNLQAWARDQRHAAAAQLALARGAKVATGHTATDQVETILYRLAASPGRRALLAMRPRDGRLIRPLLGVGREETAAHNTARGLAWREDPTNDADAFARNRVRHGLLEELRAIHPAAEANVLRTLELLRDEAEVLDAAVEAALSETRAEVAGLAALPAALRRLALQRLADRAAGGAAPAVGDRVDEVLALAPAGGSGALDLGGGLRAHVEYGRLRVAQREAAPAPAVLPVPGRVAFGGGELRCAPAADGPCGDGTLDAATLDPALEIRAWRAGDRMRPLGMAGRSRALSDLFGDRRIARDERARIPVVLSGGEIAWVPGVATGEAFKVTGGTERRVSLAWTK
jgi:tRNA(Ile)-lysidine synthase